MSLCDKKNIRRRLLYVVNVDWYFILHWLERALAAKDAGFEVHIATRISDAENVKKLIGLGFKVHNVPFMRGSMNPFNDLYSAFCLWIIFRRVHPEVAHNVTIKPVIYGGLLCRFSRIPSVCSIVGLGSAFVKKSIASTAVWWIIERLMMSALGHRYCVVLFENSHDRDVLVDRGVVAAEQTVIVPGAGVDLDRFNYVPESTSGAFKILFASRLLKSKGLEALVNAVKRLKVIGINAELHVAGIEDLDSKEPISQVSIDAWRSQGDLVWHDNVSDIERLIVMANVVCLPTTYGEGIPRILIEAAACGRSVVSTLVPGCKEFVKMNIDGILVPPDDEIALVDALEQLASDPWKRMQMGLAGRDKVERYYSNAVVMACILPQYFRLLNDKVE